MVNRTPQQQYSRRAYMALQEAIRATHLLAYSVSNDQIRTDRNYQPNFQKWVYVQAFMARRLCSHFLGAHEYEPEIIDLKFDIIRKETNNEN